MTIADIIGQVDVYSMAVALGIGAGVTILGTTVLVRPPRKKLEHEFELAKIQHENAQALALKNADIDREVKLGKIAANRQVEVARIESGMVDVKAAKSGDPSSYSE